MSSRPLIAPWRLRLRFGFRNGRLTAAWGLLILLTWLALAVFAPWIAPFDPIAQNTDISLLGPSQAHPFGTDNYGRDILSRVIWGARIDLQLAVVGVIFPFLIGTFVGAVSGYIGGRFDSFCMRVIDVILAFPFLVLMLAIMAILGPGLKSFYIAMALVGWVSYARLIRSQILVLKESDFALAAKSLGFGHGRILFRHLLPTAYRAHAGVIQLQKVLARQAHRTALHPQARGRQQAHQPATGHGLARTAFAHQAEDFTFGQVERHPVHQRYVAPGVIGDDAQVLHLQQAHERSPSTCATPSASRLKPMARVTMARPGKVQIHQAVVMNAWPSATMVPHSAVGGCTPRPR